MAESANFQNQARHHPSQPQPRKSKEAPEAEGLPLQGTRGLSLGQHMIVITLTSANPYVVHNHDQPLASFFFVIAAKMHFDDSFHSSQRHVDVFATSDPFALIVAA